MINYFKRTNPNIPKDRQDSILDPILYQDENPEVYIVTDSTMKNQAFLLKRILKSVYNREVPITLIYCYTFIPQNKDLKKDLTTFVNKYSTNYEKYIPKNTKVLVLGRSIYTFVKETYLTAEAFYSYRYTKTYFYHPPTKSYIFPVDSLEKMYSKEERRILDAFEYFFFKKQIKISKDFQVIKRRTPELSFEEVEDPNEFLRSYIGKDIEVAWDLETSGFIYYLDNIICITMSFDGRHGFYLDWKKIDLEVLNEFFKGKFQIGANLKFDCRFLRGRGVSNAKIDFDTLNAGHCLNERAANSLGAHGWLYTYYGGHEIELHNYRKKHPQMKDFSQIPRSILSKYASFDAVISYQVYKAQKELLAQEPLINSYYYNEVIPNLNLFLAIEIDGVELDWDRLSELQAIYEKKRTDLEEEIYELLGARINLSSSKDLPIFLEKKLGMPDIGARGKNGLYLTNEEVMRTWAKTGDWPVAEKLLEYKSLCTQINTFIGSAKKNSAYWKYKDIKHNSNLIHPTYGVMLALSHRNKCSSPNLQQVPKQNAFAPIFRKIFVTPTKEDYLMSEGDYSGFQMRIAAVLSGDENLKYAFTDLGGDVHSLTACSIFHPDMDPREFMKHKKEHPYKEQRAIAKTVNFQFLFGGSAWSFAEDILKLQWSKQYCTDFLVGAGLDPKNPEPYQLAADFLRNSYFASYPKLAEWHEKSHQIARRDGMVQSVFGARRLLPRLLYIGRDTPKREISDDQNVSKNTVVQNFEATAIMRGMRAYYEFAKENNLKSKIFGMIHDAVEFYIYREERDIVVPKILEIFQRDFPEYQGVNMVFELELSDPLKDEIWGFGKEVTE